MERQALSMWSRRDEHVAATRLTETSERAKR